jgi:gamma-tubulin complex component 5
MGLYAEATVAVWYNDCCKVFTTVPPDPQPAGSPASDGAWLAHLAPRFRTLKACFAGGVATRLRHAEVTTFGKRPTTLRYQSSNRHFTCSQNSSSIGQLHLPRRHEAPDMAHAARVSEIADNLVQSILGVNKDDPVIAQTKYAVSKGLRDASNARTNQFEVKSRLEGLVEKFAVLNRDDLSDALQERLEELPTESKWLPEILELFMSLSDRPVEKTAPDALATLYAAEHPDEQLTWEDIIADDPLDEPGIWDDVERGYHSSGDETRFDDDDFASDPTTSTQATSASEDSAEAVASRYVTQPDYESLDLIKRSASAFKDTSLSVAELTIVRESLSMLRGLPTNIYDLNAGNGTVRARPGTSVNGVSRRVTNDVSAQFAILGSKLQRLRSWAQSVQSRPYVNTCQAVAEEWLVGFGSQMSRLEERYVGGSVDTVVSSIEVMSEAHHVTRHLDQFAAIVARVPSNPPFALLDELYDCVCITQLSGDDETFDILSSMLFRATQTYLRPVATWVSSGTIAEGHPDFFVAENDTPCGPGDVWHSRYLLRQSDDGAPNAPRFLQGIVAEIFALGKAKMFLDQLSQGSVASDEIIGVNQVLNFGPMRQQIEDCPLMPFSDLFNETLHGWVKSISTDVTPNLKTSLLDDHGLLNLLAAVDSIYFSANGALFQSLIDSLFDRILRAPTSWSNNFLITEMARETLGEASSVDPESLFVKTDPSPKTSNITQALQTFTITYHIPWPLQNITREPSPQIHAKAFALLLQVSYAYHILQSRTFDLRALSSASIDSTRNIAFHLRHTFIVFATTLRTHITTVASVLQAEVRTAMLKAQTIDAMVAVYAAHRKRLETALLLSANLAPIREALVSGLVCCEKFGPMWDAVMAVESKRDSQLRAERALRQLQKELHRTVGFLAAGVRNVSRVGGEVLLEALAEQLELIVAR